MQSATFIKIETPYATHNIHASFTVLRDGDYTIDTITLEDTQMPTERGPIIGRSFCKDNNLKKIKRTHMIDIENAIEDYIGFNGLRYPSYGFSGMRGM